MPHWRKKRVHGIPATRRQVSIMYACMYRTPLPPPCPRCAGQLDPETRYCTGCRDWPLLNPAPAR